MPFSVLFFRINIYHKIVYSLEFFPSENNKAKLIRFSKFKEYHY